MSTRYPTCQRTPSRRAIGRSNRGLTAYLYRTQEWEEEVDLGFHNSGDVVSIAVMDSDSGLEFDDDVLYSTQVRVPWCSAFHANTTTAECEEGYTYKCDVQVTIWWTPGNRVSFIATCLCCSVTIFG